MIEESATDAPDSDLGDGFDAFTQYVSLKSHFSSKYNWKKYNGKVNVSRESYEKRRDKKFFQILQSRYSPVERNQIFLANFVYDKHLWVGELLTETCTKHWHDWKGRILRLEYQFEEDLKNALGDIQARKKLCRIEALKFLVRKPDDTHPLLLRFVWGGMFGIESYLILSQILKLNSVYTPFLADDRLWADFEHKIERYTHFLQQKLEIEKLTLILKTVTKE